MHTWNEQVAAGLATTMAFASWGTACPTVASTCGSKPTMPRAVRRELASHSAGVWSTPQSVAHTSMGCCDAASMHPALCALGAGACEHRGRQRRPSHRRRAVDGMRSGAPHSTALAVAPHLQLQNWQRQGPRGLQCGVHQRKRSSSDSEPGALLRCRSQHRGRGQGSGGGHRAAVLSAASLGVASGSR